jgi:quercetin dioxygenase-like cupin family protein
MRGSERRSFITTIAAFPLALAGQTARPVSNAVRVPGGEDRFGEHHTIGVSTTEFKVGTQDSRGDLFVMENTSTRKGGPPRHLHHSQDEWFYVIRGEYIIEIGSERFTLSDGDSILALRQIPHAYAFVGTAPGKLLLAYAPADKIEAYFRNRRTGSTYNEDAESYRAYGMELIGPPLAI